MGSLFYLLLFSDFFSFEKRLKIYTTLAKKKAINFIYKKKSRKKGIFIGWFWLHWRPVLKAFCGFWVIKKTI